MAHVGEEAGLGGVGPVSLVHGADELFIFLPEVVGMLDLCLDLLIVVNLGRSPADGIGDG